MATRSWINRFVIARVWSVDRQHHVAARADARINQSARAQFLESRFILRQSVALENRLAAPMKSEPGEVFDGGLQEFGPATRAVESSMRKSIRRRRRARVPARQNVRA